MASRVELTLYENNDETVTMTITATDATDDLQLITELELYLKTSPRYTDTDPSTLFLTSLYPGEINITTHTATQIVAEAFIPGSVLTAPYDRFWHVDGLTAGGDRRTAIYGPVDIVNL